MLRITIYDKCCFYKCIYLTSYSGYDKSAQVIKEAYKLSYSIKEIILEEKLMTEYEFAEAVRMK
ncbi:hypothetical protein [Veillonella parvula]|uniref:hypothetical protein n=1 Tax=Veillonella parvula TaxID=29466 RepID=UPI00241E988D|nr:hypothetical protein [Veillonella parvula]MDU1167023.1 hypothetical protein [Veillonella parvula]MDU1261719.1 hypothetical protein [Veillonella sp.]